jgi:hypothetical protein
MFQKRIVMVALSVFLLSAASAHAEVDAILERSKLLQEMKDKEERLKLQAQMSTHYKQMEESGFYVNETGDPVGVTDIKTMATDFRKNARKEQVGDPFSSLGPVIARDGFDSPMGPTLSPEQLGRGSSQQTNSGSQDASKDVEDRDGAFINLLEVRSNSIVVNTPEGRMELRNGQKVGEYKLSRFDIDQAFFVGDDGRTRIVGIDWTASKRYADD